MSSLAESIRNQLLSELSHHEAPQNLIASVNEARDQELESLGVRIDESPYGLSDWAEALVFFEEWRIARQRDFGFDRMCDYLGCCVEAVGASPLLPLPEVLKIYLDSQGVKPV